MIDQARWCQLEESIELLLKRNAQLEERCEDLLAQQTKWREQRDALLDEIETLLVELESLRGSTQ